MAPNNNKWRVNPELKGRFEKELASQTDDPELAARFAPIAEALGADEDAIVEELNAVQGSPVDIGGYYQPDDTLVTAAMRPSARFNNIIDAI